MKRELVTTRQISKLWCWRIQLTFHQWETKFCLLFSLWNTYPFRKKKKKSINQTFIKLLFFWCYSVLGGLLKELQKYFLVCYSRIFYFCTNCAISITVNTTLCQCSWDSHKLLIRNSLPFCCLEPSWALWITWIFFFVLYEFLVLLEVLSRIPFQNVPEWECSVCPSIWT